MVIDPIINYLYTITGPLRDLDILVTHHPTQLSHKSLNTISDSSIRAKVHRNLTEKSNFG